MGLSLLETDRLIPLVCLWLQFGSVEKSAQSTFQLAPIGHEELQAFKFLFEIIEQHPAHLGGLP